VAEDKITARGRELGVELRRRRELAGYNGQDLARRLGWSTTKVSRVETGARTVTEVDIAIYLASCGVPRDEMDWIVDLVREAGSDHRMKSHGEKLPDELRTLIFYETTAAEIDSFELLVVPGLLQTEDYTRALLLETGMYAGGSIELRVRARMERQALLRRSIPPHCTYYLYESLLRTPIGNDRIMHEQLLQLVFLSSWQHCVLRIVPISAGGGGLAQAPFRLMRYSDHDPVVEIEQDAVTLFLDRKDHTDYYRKVLNRLDRVALDEGESRRVLADLASEFDRAEEGPSV
jgi:transcriptional regulator with XRE-family HTH domain